jgi:hypothetical protein
MRVIVIIKILDIFKARYSDFVNGMKSSSVDFSLFKVLEKDLSDGIIIRITRFLIRSHEAMFIQKFSKLL